MMYEISIPFPRDALLQPLIDAIGINGADPSAIVETVVRGRRRVSVYSSTKVGAQRWQRFFERLSPSSRAVVVRAWQTHQWRDKWKTAFKPFRLTTDYDVVPIWQQKGYRARSARRAIFISPVGAFGTGLHETTRFVARLIERYGRTAVSFLDIGTGSGILAILARHIGIPVVVGIDFDEGSVTVAAENSRANGYADSVFSVGDITARGCARTRGYAFVAANLTTEVLVAGRDNICARVLPGGYLAISGVACHEEKIVRRAFAGCGLRYQSVARGKKWCALLYRRVSGRRY